MQRRRVLSTAGAAGLTGIAGCIGFLGSETSNEPPLVEDPPDAVYYPTHVEGMQMAGMASAGPYRVAMTYTFPHRFWTVTGQDTTRVEVDSDSTVHLMTVIWDAETSINVPTSEISWNVRQDDESVVQRTPWPMLSQPMGYHFGDNVALPGDGTYDVTVELPPVGARTTGAFEGRFDEAQTATVSVEYSEATLNGVSFRRLPDLQGDQGAVSPMEMEMMPVSRLPAPEDLPGEPFGSATSGDGRFVVQALEAPPTGIDGPGRYLAVSARTPHNGYPLPFMALSATVARDGSAVFDDVLRPAIDPDLDYHYGAVVESLEPGDEIEFTVDAPPQVARHEGYETAFLDMPPMTLTV